MPNDERLEAIRAEVMQHLVQGAADRTSPFRHPALATVDAAGAPAVRTVVLRAFDPVTRALWVHSDRRAAKVAQLERQSRVALHVWDATAQVQVQIWGAARLHSCDEAARLAWKSLHATSRASYAVNVAPGTVVPDPATADSNRLTPGDAFRHFICVEVTVDELQWLRLDRAGNRRAMFAYGGEQWLSHWLVP